MSNNIKRINLNIQIKEDYINTLFECFNFWKEYDNLQYNSDIYEFDYGSGKKKYKNCIFIINIILSCSTIIYGVEYIVAREIFNSDEIIELQKFCPCYKCLKNNYYLTHEEIFKNYCIKEHIMNQYKNIFIITPLVHEARKLSQTYILK